MAATITAENGEQRTFGTGNVRGVTVRVTGFDRYDLNLALINGTYREICVHCSGTGYRPGYGYSDGSRCWPCRYVGVGRVYGTGSLEDLLKRLKRRAQDAARRQAKREQAAAQAAAEHLAWVALHPEAHAAALAVTATAPDYDSPASPFSPKLVELSGGMCYRIMTDAQVALLLDMYRTEAPRIAAKAAAKAARAYLGNEGDRVTFTGKVIFRTTSEAYNRISTFHRVITADGNSVSWWRTGYCPIEVGATVTVTATVKTLKDTREYGKETIVTRATVQA